MNITLTHIPDFRLRYCSALLLLCGIVIGEPAGAYIATGDHQYPPTILLPPVAPADDIYLAPGTLPLEGGSRFSNVALTYDKTITESLGFGVEVQRAALDLSGGPTFRGWQNLQAELQYLLTLDTTHEYLVAVSVAQEFGGTGAARVGAEARSATTPMINFAKGFGDTGIDWLKPFAIEGMLGYAIGYGDDRPDQIQAGVALEYSVPYLESNVVTMKLPDLVRNLTPMVEFIMATPAGNTHGATTTATLGPGFDYAGEGWDFGIEAQLPLTHATGRGPGVIAQLHLSLDFFYPETIGRPLFGAE